jgi:hypothetical protein
VRRACALCQSHRCIGARTRHADLNADLGLSKAALALALRLGKTG